MIEGHDLILIGRSQTDLVDLARELEKACGRAAPCVVWDVLDFAGHAEHFRNLVSAHALKGIFFAAGIQIPQEECDREPAKTRLTFDTNLTGPAVILGLFAEHFKTQSAQGSTPAFISCVSSVAGDRGRGKVLAYAASKAGLTAYLAGLRHRLSGTGILVQTLKPGFVKTRMVGDMQSPLMATPERVALEITAALRNRREVVYTPFFWRYIMAIIKAMPNPIFKRLKF
jgi:short-subunit dehydrogenase